jgi:hypothetical protein
MRGRKIAACVVGLAAGIATVHHLAAREIGACALPPRDCDGSAAYCGDLVWFAPARGPGYEDVPLDDEVAVPDSTSYARRDLMMLIKYAAAKVACLRGGHPIALGDISDRDGQTPGAVYGMPRHPRGTHVAGRDIDLAYYQRDTPDNHLRPICPHVVDGVEQWHCTAPPTTLDAQRSALFIGFLFESPHVRIVGIDGAAAGPIKRALDHACAAGTIPADACARVRLGYELADTGRLWYFGHHNHMHVSWAR